MKFGFIGFGEVSYTLSKILIALDFEVLTSLEGRSKDTIDLARSLDLTILDSYNDVARQSDVLISANSPAIALDIANKYGTLTDGIFLDFNNISPSTVFEIETLLSDEHFIDSAIFGRVSSNELNIFLSGKRAQELLDNVKNQVHYKNDILIDKTDLKINIKVISDRIGDVSKLKMLRSYYTKGVSALLIETFETAQKLGLDNELWDVLALTENRDFKESSKSRINSSYVSSKRKFEELNELLNFLDDVYDVNDGIGSQILAKAIRDKFEYLFKNSEK